MFGLGIAGALIYEGPRLFERRYPRTKYDDLLDQLPDRESAARLGKIVVEQAEARSPGRSSFDAESIAHELRKGTGKGALALAVQSDIDRGRLVEVGGWVLPVSETLAAALAATVQQGPSAV